eukprot:TRINITY_DN2063_c0_g1_i2.p1 TRINITY_DN2063_c0_g1~~TRINITY_DN2063_c0_g1_i2.p1  ORF type:complete len:414 (-),score=68.42 TRINITY_DN2063_c0_g1_i2:278-1519(-)
MKALVDGIWALLICFYNSGLLQNVDRIEVQHLETPSTRNIILHRPIACHRNPVEASQNKLKSREYEVPARLPLFLLHVTSEEVKYSGLDLYCEDSNLKEETSRIVCESCEGTLSILTSSCKIEVKVNWETLSRPEAKTNSASRDQQILVALVILLAILCFLTLYEVYGIIQKRQKIRCENEQPPHRTVFQNAWENFCRMKARVCQDLRQRLDNILEVHNYMQNGPSPPPPQEQVPEQPVGDQGGQRNPFLPQQSSGPVIQDFGQNRQALIRNPNTAQIPFTSATRNDANDSGEVSIIESGSVLNYRIVKGRLPLRSYRNYAQFNGQVASFDDDIQDGETTQEEYLDFSYQRNLNTARVDWEYYDSMLEKENYDPIPPMPVRFQDELESRRKMEFFSLQHSFLQPGTKRRKKTK